MHVVSHVLISARSVNAFCSCWFSIVLIASFPHTGVTVIISTHTQEQNASDGASRTVIERSFTSSLKSLSHCSSTTSPSVYDFTVRTFRSSSAGRKQVQQFGLKCIIDFIRRMHTKNVKPIKPTVSYLIYGFLRTLNCWKAFLHNLLHAFWQLRLFFLATKKSFSVNIKNSSVSLCIVLMFAMKSVLIL